MFTYAPFSYQQPCLCCKRLSYLNADIQNRRNESRFTIGLEPFADANGNLIEGRFVPRTLRVKDKAIENSREAEFVDFIFSKAATVSKYDTMAFRDGTKSFPEIIKQMLAQNLTEISS